MYAVGIDIGGTNIKVVNVTAEGRILSQMSSPTEDAEVVDWAERITAHLLWAEAERGEPAACIGIAAPGFVARDGRSIAWMHGRMDAIEGLDWTTYLDSKEIVPVLNDAQAALVGEAWIGAAQGCRNVVLLTLGTGVGGGVMVDGRVLQGHLGRAGHLGHISLDPRGKTDIVGTPGSLEDAIGECTLWDRTDGRFGSMEALVAAHRDGDAEATTVWMRSVEALAAGIVSLINVADPEIVVLGGGIAKAGNALFVPLQGLLDAWEWRPTGQGVRLVPASLGEYAGAFGAAYNAMQVASLCSALASSERR